MVSATPAPGAPGSLRSVRDAVAAGALTLDDLQRATGLDRELVRLALDRLVVLGELDAEPLAVGCPDDGCGGCSSAASSCSPRTGPVPVALTLRWRPPS